MFELKRKFALNCPDINTQHDYFQSHRIIAEPEKSASINVSVEEKTDNKSCTIGCSSQKPLISRQVGKVCRSSGTAMQLQDVNTSRGLARPNELKATERRNARHVLRLYVS